MADMHPDLLTLNDDVLVLLVSYLDSASARRLSYTARGVHLIAKHQALRSVTLRSFRKVTKFCTYMLTDMPHRLSALYELRLHCSLFGLQLSRGIQSTSDAMHNGPDATNLTSLLRRTDNLRVLVMESAETWMVYQPDMVDVLSSMQTLQDIELGIVGAHTLDFIHRMKSAPRKVAFDIFTRACRLLLHSRPHRLSNQGLLKPYLRLPSVEILAADSALHSPDLMDLARAFPSTKYLDMRLLRKSDNRHHTTTTVTWPSLERVRCTLGSFDGWTSTAVIHLLQVVDQLADSDAAPMHIRRSTLIGTSTVRVVDGRAPFAAAIPVLNSLQPVALVVDVDVNSDARSLAEVIRSSSRLRYLAIRVALSAEFGYKQLKTWWIILFSALSTDCNIVCIEFLVGCGSSESQNRHSSGGRIVPPNEGLGRILQALAQWIPRTLRYLSLDIGLTRNLPWRHDFLSPEELQEVWVPATLQWWGLESAGHVRAMKVLDAVRGERIAAYLRSTQYDHNKFFDERDVPGL